MYLESEVFESHGEQKRGERAVEDAEHRLGLFLRRLGERGLADGSGMKLQQSKQAMRMFLELNASILNLLKVRELRIYSSDYSKSCHGVVPIRYK